MSKKVKYRGLSQHGNLKIRKELLDQDYIDKLSEKEKQWLSNFMLEYVQADFKHPGKRLHKTKKHVKSVYDANNARNRDALAITKSNGMLKGLTNQDAGREDMVTTRKQNKQIGMSGSHSTNLGEVEDTWNLLIDLKK